MFNARFPRGTRAAPRFRGTALSAVTDVPDHVDHLMTDEELARCREVGRGRAVCGLLIAPAPLVVPPRSRCRSCMDVARRRSECERRGGRQPRRRRVPGWSRALRPPAAVGRAPSDDPGTTPDDHLAITKDQTAALPSSAAAPILDAVAEYEAQDSVEARCAKDADKLECLIQAVEYRCAGNQDAEQWITSSRAALRTRTAQAIADAALLVSPVEWRS